MSIAHTLHKHTHTHSLRDLPKVCVFTATPTSQAALPSSKPPALCITLNSQRDFKMLFSFGFGKRLLFLEDFVFPVYFPE